jgi:predicted  nucleic acid-binding Zn-ribbon protein
MKFKAVLVLTAALSFGGALAQDAMAPAPVAPTLTDVPAGHWAKDAVDLLVSKGIIIGFPDGTFRGNETLTRYQAALMIQRLLDMMVTNQAPIMNPEELETIRNAVQELASDLAALGVRVADLEDKAVSQDDFATLQDTVSGFDSTISDLSSQLEGKAAQEDVDALSARVDDLEGQLGDSAAAMEELAAAVGDLGSQVGDLSGRVDDLEAGLGDTQAGLEEVQGNLATAQESIDGLTATSEELQAAIDELSGALEETTATAEDALSQAEELQGKYDELAGTVADNAAALEDNTAADAELAAALEDNTAADAELAARVDELEAGLGDLASAVEDNTSSITSLNDLTVLLNQDILDLQDQVSSVLARLDDTDVATAAKFEELNGLINDVDSHLNDLSADVDSRFDAVAADIDDLRAYDAVLRSDLDTTIGRVTVLEKGLVDVNAKVDKVSDRVATLEQDYGFTVSGSLGFNYYASALSGRDFDIDRIIPGSRLSTGNSTDVDGNDNGATPVDFNDLGRPGTVTGTSPQQVGDTTGLNGFASGKYTYVVKYTDATTKTVVTVNLIGAADKLVVLVSQPGGAKPVVGATAGDNGTSDNNVFTTTLPIGATGIEATATPLANRSVEGKGSISLDFSVSFKNRAVNGKSANLNKLAAPSNTFEVQQVVGEFGLTANDNLGAAGGIANGDTKLTQPVLFYVKNITNNFTAGGAPVTLQFGLEPKVKFSDYVFDNDKTTRGAGLNATIDGSTIAGLGAFKPKIVLVYGSKNGANGDFGYYSGARAEITTSGITAGLNYAVEGGDGLSPKGIAFNTANGQTTVMGANLKGEKIFGTGINLTSEFATSTNSSPSATPATIFYVDANADFGTLKIDDVNYRSIDGKYGAKASVSETDPANGDNGSNALYAAGQTGFGGKATVTLGAFKVSGYYDQVAAFSDASKFSRTALGGNAKAEFGPVSVDGFADSVNFSGTESLGSIFKVPGLNTGLQFGVNASVKLFSGLSAYGNYKNVTIGGTPQDDPGLIQSGYDYDKGLVANKYGKYENGFKVGLKHDGAASDALIKGLNLDGSFGQFNKDLSRQEIVAKADYAGTLGDGFKLGLNAGYESKVDSKTATDDTTKITAGASLSTPVLATIPLKPSFAAKVNIYNTSHADAAVYTASDLSYQITAKFDAFLFDKSTFAASYGSWDSTNRDYYAFVNSDNKGTWNDFNGAAKTTLSGYTLEWNLYDVSLAFGDFNLVGNGENNRGQAFRIGYKVTF